MRHIPTLEARRALDVERRWNPATKQWAVNVYTILPLEGILPDPTPLHHGGRPRQAQEGGRQLQLPRVGNSSCLGVGNSGLPEASQPSIPMLSIPSEHPIIGASHAPREQHASPHQDAHNGFHQEGVQNALMDAVGADTPLVGNAPPAAPAPPAATDPPPASGAEPAATTTSRRKSQPRAKKPPLAEREPELAAARDKAVAYWEEKTGKQRNGGTLKQVEALLRKHSLEDVIGTIDDLWDQVDWRGELTGYYRDGRMSWSAIADRVVAHQRGDLKTVRNYQAPKDGGRGRDAQRSSGYFQPRDEMEAEMAAERARGGTVFCGFLECGRMEGHPHKDRCPSGLGGALVTREQDPGEELIAYWVQTTGNRRTDTTAAEVKALLSQHTPAQLRGTIADLWNAVKADGSPDEFWQQPHNMSWKAIGKRVADHKANKLRCRRTYTPSKNGKNAQRPIPQTREDSEKEQRLAPPQCHWCYSNEGELHEAGCRAGLVGQPVRYVEQMQWVLPAGEDYVGPGDRREAALVLRGAPPPELAPALLPPPLPRVPSQPQPVPAVEEASPAPEPPQGAKAPDPTVVEQLSAPPSPAPAPAVQRRQRTPEEMTKDLWEGLKLSKFLNPNQLAQLEGFAVRRWDTERLELVAPTPQVKHAAEREKDVIDKYLRRSHQPTREIVVVLATPQPDGAPAIGVMVAV
jgi:hypothetical protein